MKNQPNWQAANGGKRALGKHAGFQEASAPASTVELRPESADRYSVTLLTPERVGVSAVCRYLGASYQDASDEAHRIGRIYRADVRDLTK